MDEDEQLEEHQREQDILLADALRDLQQMENVQRHYNAEIETAKAKICGMLDERGEKSASTSLDGSVYRITVVAGERIRVDEAGLKAHIGARAWNKLTVRKVSNDLVREAITTGAISAVVAAEYIEIRPTKVFPKITVTARVGE